MKTIQKLLRRGDAFSESVIRYLIRVVPAGERRQQVQNLRRERLVWRFERRTRAAILRDTFAQLSLILWPLWLALGAALTALYSRYSFVLFILPAILAATGHAVFRRRRFCILHREYAHRWHSTEDPGMWRVGTLGLIR